ncbi:MAG: hypothetical protein ABSG80_03130 [Verrucomicrobiota bacterium]
MATKELVMDAGNETRKETGKAKGNITKFKKELPALIAEFLFMLLPLLVVSIVRLFLDEKADQKTVPKT